MTAFVLPSHLLRKRAPSTKPRQTPEKTLQMQVATWLSRHVDIPWTAVGHGISTIKRVKTKDGRWISPEGNTLKKMGVRAGWPDIHFIHQKRACYIELKSEKGAVSDAQRDVHVAITAAGGIVSTCRSLDEVIGFLDMLGVPLRS